MFVFYSDSDKTSPAGSTNDLFNVIDPVIGEILAYDGSHFTNTHILSGSNIDLINIDPNNLIGTIPYGKLPAVYASEVGSESPFVASISPNISVAGTQNIVILGENFHPNTSINIANCTITNLVVASPTKITCTIIKNIPLSGDINITVSNGNNTNNDWIDSIKSVFVHPDQYYLNTILWIKNIGENNSILFTDSSPNNKSITRFGDAKISTDQAKYNGSSIYFDGSGDYLQVNDLPINFSGDFTIEAWVFFVNTAPTTIYAGNNVGDHEFIVYSNQIAIALAGVSWELQLNHSTPLNTWNHFAFSRQGSTLRIFKNGGLVYSFTYSTSIKCTGNLLIGRGRDGARQATGYLSHVRITNIARYTVNFNAETDTFLNV